MTFRVLIWCDNVSVLSLDSSLVLLAVELQLQPLLDHLLPQETLQLQPNNAQLKTVIQEMSPHMHCRRLLTVLGQFLVK